MMAKSLDKVAKTLFADTVRDDSRMSLDYSKFESTPNAEHVELVCRSMIPKLLEACPEAFASELVNDATVCFLVNVFLDDPSPWITLEAKDHYSGRRVTDTEWSCLGTVVSGRPRVMLNSMLNVVYTLSLFINWCNVNGM